jgi:hypothetical protein
MNKKISKIFLIFFERLLPWGILNVKVLHHLSQTNKVLFGILGVELFSPTLLLPNFLNMRIFKQS